MLRKFGERQVERHKKHQAERDAVKGENMTFVIEPYEQKKAFEWLAEHNKTCSLRFDKDGNPVQFPGGAAGGCTSYRFTMTGIGMATEVMCGCGESENITDYEQW